MKWELKEDKLFPYMAILLWGYNKVHKTVCEINVTCRDWVITTHQANQPYRNEPLSTKQQAQRDSHVHFKLHDQGTS